ncbi:phage tail sheath protein [Brevibacillus laterosporus]|nr:phage tail sheath C-terminal domain-containing protein [Brevibacillus laterosporus]TPG71167.1 phage tail sheath protein [Brevibacillus laterosporus]
MGLPQIDIIFKSKAVTAIEESAKGILTLILKDDTIKTFDEKVYKGIEEVNAADWKVDNLDYIKKAFLGTPSEVRIQRMDAEATDCSSVLSRIQNQVWHYLAFPEISESQTTDVSIFIKTQRKKHKKSYKAVLPNSPSDDEGVINFTTDEIKTSDKTYSTAQFCPRLAGVFAGLGFDRSATFFDFPDVLSIKEHENPDEDIDSGKLILINDGKKIKIGRAVNSFKTFTPEKSKSFSKIAVVEVMDFIKDSIHDTYSNYYIGKVKNTYFNKLAFVGAINAFLKGLVDVQALDPTSENKVYINIDAQRQYIESQGMSLADKSDQAVKMMNTDAWLFIRGDNIKPLDAMEDLKMVGSF